MQVEVKLDPERKEIGIVVLAPAPSPELDELVRRLDGPRKIGLTATDTCLLAPIKSVTAVIGLSNTPGKCHSGGCATCSKTNCAFRRDTT